MTLHVVYNHQCSECEAFYIPYDKGVTCPRCGADEGEPFAYIEQAVASMRFNKQAGGHYTPGAWWVGSLGDHILHLLFLLFDAYDQAGPVQDFDSFAREYLARMEWGDQDYLREHIHGIAARVLEELSRA